MKAEYVNAEIWPVVLLISSWLQFPNLELCRCTTACYQSTEVVPGDLEVGRGCVRTVDAWPFMPFSDSRPSRSKFVDTVDP